MPSGDKRKRGDEQMPLDVVLRNIEERTSRDEYPHRLARIRRLCGHLFREANSTQQRAEAFQLSRFQSIEALLRRILARCQSWEDNLTPLSLLLKLNEDMDLIDDDLASLSSGSRIEYIHQSTADEAREDCEKAFPLLNGIIRGSEGRTRACLLQDRQAEVFLALLQDELDNRSPGHDAGFRGKAIKVMTELAKRSGRFPSALWLRDVPHDRVATAGGGFGDIHKGCWRNQEVALKFHRYFTQDHDRTTEMKKQFCREALLWRQLSHKHILPFLGVYQEPEGPKLAMVSPFQSAGNIMQYLKTSPDADRYELLIQATRGLVYLHQQKPPVIHSDLKPDNILISNEGAMLADFGFSTIQHDLTGSMWYSVGGGTSWYKSPELLLDSIKPTCSSDIWALGMVIYEVFMEKQAFSQIVAEGAFIWAMNKWRSGEPLRNDIEPQKPNYIASSRGFIHALWEFLKQKCWAIKMDKRPSARGCLMELEALAMRWASQQRTNVASPRVMDEVFLQVQPRYARSLINDRSYRLRSLSEQFGVRVQVHGPSYSSLKLVGERDGVNGIRAEILSDMENAAITTSALSIPNRLHGIFIGPRGESIKPVEDRYAVKIHFYGDQADIRGVTRDVTAAATELREALEYHELYDDILTVPVGPGLAALISLASQKGRIILEAKLRSLDVRRRLGENKIELRGSKQALQDGQDLIAELQQQLDKEITDNFVDDPNVIRTLLGKTLADIVLRCNGPSEPDMQRRLVTLIPKSGQICLRGEPQLVLDLKRELRREMEQRRRVVIGMCISYMRHPALLREVPGRIRPFVHFPTSSGYKTLPEPENFADLVGEDPQDIVKMYGTREECINAQDCLKALVEDQKQLERKLTFKAKYQHEVAKHVEKDIRAMGMCFEPIIGKLPPRPLSPQAPTMDDHAPHAWHKQRRFDPEDVEECTWLLKVRKKEDIEKGHSIVHGAVQQTSSASWIGLLTFRTSLNFGHIVGNQGTRVRHMEDETKTRIEVPRRGNGTTIKIIGSNHRIDAAKDRILRLLEDISPWQTVASPGDF